MQNVVSGGNDLGNNPESHIDEGNNDTGAVVDNIDEACITINQEDSTPINVNKRIMLRKTTITTTIRYLECFCSCPSPYV